MSTPKNIAAWTVVGLLCVGLMGFGATNFAGTTTALGTAGDKDISLAQYSRALRQRLAETSQQMNTQVSFAQARALGLDQQVLAEVVQRRVIDHEVARLGVSTPDSYVRDEVISNPALMGTDGTFDRAAYAFALERMGSTEQEYEAAISDDLSRVALVSAVSDGVAAPEHFAEVLIAYQTEARDLTWATLSADLIAPAPTAPEGEALRSYYDENISDFMAPQVHRVAAARLTPDMLIDEIALDETALRARYEERADEFRPTERRLVERLAFADEAAAQAARARLDDGSATFEDLVAERGLDLADTDMGDVTASQLGQAAEAVFAAETGAVVGPAVSRVGPALFRVNGRLAPPVISYEEALPQLREDLGRARAVRRIDDLRDEIEDLLAGGARIEDLVARTQMVAETLEWSEGSGDGLAAYEELRRLIPTLEVDEFATLVPLGDGGLAAVRVTEIIPPAPRPFGEAQTAVADAWIAAETKRRLADLAQTLAAQLREGASFAELGLAPTTSPMVARGDYMPGAPADLLTRAFAAEVGAVEVLDAAAPTLLRVDAEGRKDTPEDELASARATTAARLQQSLRRDLIGQFSTRLQERTKIELNQGALNAVHAGFN